MADSDRNRSPAPVRNRTEPRGQVHAPRPELPFFPRWRGPMNSSTLHFQNMPRPQSRPQRAMSQPGPYMMGRRINPSQSMMQTNWSNHQFPPTPPPSIPSTLPYLPPSRQATPPCSPTMPCPPTQLCSPAHLPSLRPSHGRMNQLLRPHQKALAIGDQNLWVWPRPSLAGRQGSLRQPEDQWIDIPPDHSSVSFHSKAGHWRVWSFGSTVAGLDVSTGQQFLASKAGSWSWSLPDPYGGDRNCCLYNGAFDAAQKPWGRPGLCLT